MIKSSHYSRAQDTYIDISHPLHAPLSHAMCLLAFKSTHTVIYSVFFLLVLFFVGISLASWLLVHVLFHRITAIRLILMEFI